MVFCFCISLLTLAGNAVAAVNKGIQFQDEISVDGEIITLYGIGLLKWKYLVNVYLVGLYKPENISIKLVLEDVPKRLEYYFLWI